MSRATPRQNASTNEAISFIDLNPPASDFRADVISGLSSAPRSLSPKYLYDAKGSALFDEICKTPEYYITRTEIALLDKIGPEVAALVPPGAAVIEYGAGSTIKIRTLIDALDKPSSFMALDISREHLLAAAEDMACDHPKLDVIAVAADFTQALDLPTEHLGDAFRLGFLPGSTIGNFPYQDQVDILSRMARQLGRGAGLLIGADRVKEKRRLEAAYDDEAGTTARFSLNLLERISSELGAEIDVSAFKHVAVYDTDLNAIRIWLESKRDTEIRLDGHVFGFSEGDKIETELAHKYTTSSFQDLAREAGFEPRAHWTDVEELISLHYLIVT